MAAPRSRSANAEYGRDGKEQARQRDLVRLLQLSIAAAIVTIALKTVAWALTGSIGLLSDAAESIVNLVAALVALLAVQWAARPPDEDHAYGHDKADYFSAGFEGGLVLLAALAIIVFSVARIFHPTSIDHVAIGVTVTAIAGGLAIYLLIGMLFAVVISVIASVESAHYFTQGTNGSTSDRVYYSFTTMTTVGFGDFTAATRPGKTVAVLEMLVGQIYLVTVISLLVARAPSRPLVERVANTSVAESGGTESTRAEG